MITTKAQIHVSKGIASEDDDQHFGIAQSEPRPMMPSQFDRYEAFLQGSFQYNCRITINQKRLVMILYFF